MGLGLRTRALCNKLEGGVIYTESHAWGHTYWSTVALQTPIGSATQDNIIQS